MRANLNYLFLVVVFYYEKNDYSQFYNGKIVESNWRLQSLHLPNVKVCCQPFFFLLKKKFLIRKSMSFKCLSFFIGIGQRFLILYLGKIASNISYDNLSYGSSPFEYVAYGFTFFYWFLNVEYLWQWYDGHFQNNFKL